MSSFRFAAFAPLLMLAACGAKPGATETRTASLIRGSWTCSATGPDKLGGSVATETLSITYVSDGTWAASSEWKSKGTVLGIASRGRWEVVDGALHRSFTYYTATQATVNGKTVDHGEINRAAQILAREMPEHHPLKSTLVTSFTELTADRMVGIDNAATSTSCERLKA